MKRRSKMTNGLKRRPGRPRTRKTPPQRILVRATNKEIDRIYKLDTRLRAEVLLAECDRIEAAAGNDEEN